MFMIKDAIVGLWYIIGNFIISKLWGNVLEDLKKAKTDIRNMEIQFREETVRMEEAIEELIKEHDRQLDAISKEYTDLESRYADAYLKIEKYLNPAKKKDPSKPTKPIKPRTSRKK